MGIFTMIKEFVQTVHTNFHNEVDARNSKVFTEEFKDFALSGLISLIPRLTDIELIDAKKEYAKLPSLTNRAKIALQHINIELDKRGIE